MHEELKEASSEEWDIVALKSIHRKGVSNKQLIQTLNRHFGFRGVLRKNTTQLLPAFIYFFFFYFWYFLLLEP